MAGFNLSSNALLISFVVLVSGIATANCKVLFINNSTSFLSVGNFAEKTFRMDPMEPKEVSSFEKLGSPTSRDAFFIELYVEAQASFGREMPLVTPSLVLETVADIFVYDDATVTVLDPKDKIKGHLSVHVDYPVARKEPVHAPASSPAHVPAQAPSTGAHAASPHAFSRGV